MMKRWMQMAAVVTTAAALACTPSPTVGAAPSSSDFAAWDLDRDGQLGPNEFAPRWGTTFEAWDLNDDMIIDRDEFRAGVGADIDAFGDFNVWDTNGDARLSPYEFTDGSFGFFDGDDDGFIDDGEWNLRVSLW